MRPTHAASTSLKALPRKTREAIARRWMLGAMATTLFNDVFENGAEYISADAEILGLDHDDMRRLCGDVVAKLRAEADKPLRGQPCPRPGAHRV
jgi:hypothetical protein